jgi:hypothetical protein
MNGDGGKLLVEHDTDAFTSESLSQILDSHSSWLGNNLETIIIILITLL